MTDVLFFRSRWKLRIAAALVALPAILFYSALFRRAINLPLEDDYEALVDFLNKMVELSSFSAKASYFLAAQYNEYKLFFEHAVAWLQYCLSGRINIQILCAVGNLFVLLLAIILWKMFLPGMQEKGDRLALFVPISWLIFQLGYVETLDWAMAALQNLPVLVFAFGTICLLVRSTKGAFWGSGICFLLAVAASGNGLILIPVGMLILVLGRHYRRLAIWSLFCAVSVWAYAYRYNVMSSQSRAHDSVLSTVMHPRPLYVLAFLGNAAAFPLVGRLVVLRIALCLALGLLLCVWFGFLVRRGYARRNPTVCFCVLFLLLTAIGVAGLRSDFGIMQSLSSRYSIYSVLLLIMAWFAIVEEVLLHQDLRIPRERILVVASVGAILFALSMDVIGWRFLAWRNHKVIVGMAAYENPGCNNLGTGPILRVPNQNARFDELDREAPVILTQSRTLGLYAPPEYECIR